MASLKKQKVVHPYPFVAPVTSTSDTNMILPAWYSMPNLPYTSDFESFVSDEITDSGKIQLHPAMTVVDKFAHHPMNYKPKFLERTLVLLKPDAFERNLVGEIISILDSKELTLVAAKQIRMDVDLVKQHYKNHIGKGFFPELVMFMTSGPSLALVYEGTNACNAVRQLIGEKHPGQSSAGSIRGRFATEYPRNLIHGSDNMDEAYNEIALYFSDNEIFNENMKQTKKIQQIQEYEKEIEEIAKVVEAGLTPGQAIPHAVMVKPGMNLQHATGKNYTVSSTEATLPVGMMNIHLASDILNAPWNTICLTYELAAPMNDWTLLDHNGKVQNGNQTF